MDVLNTLANMKENEQKLFLTIRNRMRKAYMLSIKQTIGIENYNETDDTFLDAIDIKCEMLAARAGMSTMDNENINAEENVLDPFAMITRPTPATELKVDEGKLEGSITKPTVVDWAPQAMKVG